MVVGRACFRPRYHSPPPPIHALVLLVRALHPFFRGCVHHSTLDSFGLQYVDVICDPSHYSKAHRLFSMKSAMGAQRWLTLTAHPTAT